MTSHSLILIGFYSYPDVKFMKSNFRPEGLYISLAQPLEDIGNSHGSDTLLNVNIHIYPGLPPILTH